MLYNPFSLEGKKILITGASSGIGQVTAIECAKLGANVILTGRNEERLKSTLELMVGDNHNYIIADLSNTNDIADLVEKVPCVDGFVNNAGYNKMSIIQFIKESALESIMDVNLNAPIILTNLLIKRKKINKLGSIVFTSSIAKNVPTMGNGMYAATKGGLSSFMKVAAIELASKKIRCNAVLPGMIETPLKEGKSLITDEQWELNKQLYPLKRFGNPLDVAWGIIYLLSDASQWVTGSELVIDGGRSLK